MLSQSVAGQLQEVKAPVVHRVQMNAALSPGNMARATPIVMVDVAFLLMI